MPITGTVRNGQVEFDDPVTWPDGTRVTLVLDDDEIHEYPHSMEPYDHEKELEGLMESIEDMKAGRVIPFDVAMRELAIKHHLTIPDFNQ
jgi:hypothetical protein